jgi:hypothetical protein
MTKPSFINRLNWRLILLHLVACWCFAYAFSLFSWLHDLDYIKYVLTHSGQGIFKMPGVTGRRIADLLMWSALSYPAGLLICFILSMVISRKKRWFWLNGFISFLVACLLFHFKFTGWIWLKFIFLTPGQLFGNFSAGYFILNGIVLLVLGLLCLFLPMAVEFIERGHILKTDKSLEVASD